MLEKVKLVNFKSHKSTEFNLDSSRLHALVGQNGSGKTSVLQAIHYLSMLTNSDFTNVFQNERLPEFLTTIGQKNMSVTGSGFWGNSNQENCKASYSWQKRSNGWSPMGVWQVGKNIEKRDKMSSSLSEAPPFITESLRYAVHLKLVARDLTKAAYSDAIEPRLDFDSSLLAPTLDYIRAEAPEKFQALHEMLQRIVPGVKKIGVRRAKVPVNRQRSIEVDGKSIRYEENQEIIGQEVVLDMNTGERIPSHAISEGTMLTLGLLTVLMNPKQPNLVLLDDIEQGLHPKANET